MKMTLQWEKQQPSCSSPSPKQKVLEGLLGCLNYDLVEMLTKAKQNVLKIQWDVEASQTQEEPKVFEELYIKCFVEGNVDEKKLSRFLWLSLIKHCGVHAMLKNSGASLSYQLFLSQKEIPIQDSSYDQEKFKRWFHKESAREDFKGLALVTGASRGIGRFLSYELSQKGYAVLALCRTIKEMNPQSPHEYMLSFELKEPHCYKMLSSLLKEYSQKIDLVYHNAGIIDWKEKNPSSTSFQTLYRTFHSNTFSPICFQNYIKPLLSSQAFIFFTTSIMGDLQYEGTIAPSYRLSKSALHMWVQLLARENQEQTFIAFHPGSVKTDMNPYGKITIEDSVSRILKFLDKKEELKKNNGSFWIVNEKEEPSLNLK